MSNETTVVKKNTVEDDKIVIQDPAKAIDTAVKSINNINVELSKRNCVGPKKDELQKAFKDTVTQMVDLTSASIVQGLLEPKDLYDNILQAKVDKKTFKKCSGHVNKIIKEYIQEEQKIEIHEGATISTVELAKLIKTPYKYADTEEEMDVATDDGYDENNVKQVDVEEVPEVNGDTVVETYSTQGERIVFDKEEGTAYVNGNKKGETVTWKKKLAGKGFTWAMFVKNVIGGIFKLVWDIVYAVCANTVGVCLGLLSLGTTFIMNTGKDIAGAGVNLWHTLKEAHSNAVSEAIEKGYVV